MRNAKKLLVAVALVGAAILTTPRPAQATPWCLYCEKNGDCWSCCRCAGGTIAYCHEICNY